jgi:hypothetical protein
MHHLANTPTPGLLHHLLLLLSCPPAAPCAAAAAATALLLAHLGRALVHLAPEQKVCLAASTHQAALLPAYRLTRAAAALMCRMPAAQYSAVQCSAARDTCS